MLFRPIILLAKTYSKAICQVKVLTLLIFSNNTTRREFAKSHAKRASCHTCSRASRILCPACSHASRALPPMSVSCPTCSGVSRVFCLTFSRIT